MERRLFVTCGRGLTTFAKDEIQEKVPMASDICTIGDEGKVAFSIKCGTNIGENSLFVKALMPVFDLKMVERLYLLVYSEEIPQDFTIDETKLMSVLKTVDLDEAMDLLQSLKTHKEQAGANVRTFCVQPDSCPGSLNRRAYIEERQQKRRNWLLLRNSKRQGKDFNNQQKRKLDSDADGPYGVNKRGKNDANGAKEENFCKDEFPDQFIGMEDDMDGCDENNYPELDPHPQLNTVIQQRVPNEAVKTNTGLANIKSEDPIDRSSSIRFRLSCRIRRNRKKYQNKFDNFSKTFVKVLTQLKSNWVATWARPNVVLYANITNTHFIIGVSLSHLPLSLRPYVPHITLRSTNAYLISKLCGLVPGDILLDPTCGGGSILAEAANCYNLDHVIGGDINVEQLEIARCNLNRLKIPFSLLRSQATALPLKSGSVNAVVCDFPFGKKYRLKNDENFFFEVLEESCRVMVPGGRAVFLVSRRQRELLNEYSSADSITSTTTIVLGSCIMKIISSHPVSLGTSEAYIFVFVK